VPGRFSWRSLGLGIALVLTLLWTLSPYLWQVITSFKPSAELASLPPVFPTRIALESYREVFVDQPFARIILNSVVVATSTTLLSLLIGSLAAFALAKLPVKRKVLWLGLFLSISMFPPIATVSPLYLAIRMVGIRDTYLALIFPYTTFTLPLAVWILTSFFRDIPDDLYRSARVDGCTPLQAFRRILFPLAAPGVFTAAILIFIFAWNEFLFALTFTSTVKSRTIPVGIALFPGLHEVPWGEIAAASVIVTVPLIAVVLVFQRRIISGLTAGAIRG
jgi:multiple sugar transport system permease protein